MAIKKHATAQSAGASRLQARSCSLQLSQLRDTHRDREHESADDVAGIVPVVAEAADADAPGIPDEVGEYKKGTFQQMCAGCRQGVYRRRACWGFKQVQHSVHHPQQRRVHSRQLEEHQAHQQHGDELFHEALAKAVARHVQPAADCVWQGHEHLRCQKVRGLDGSQVAGFLSKVRHPLCPAGED